jgi:sarcosine oxidase delta subunit
MSALSYLVGTLTCPCCGETSAADLTASITNQLSPRPDGEIFRVGDHVDLDVTDFQSAFFVLRRPNRGEDIHVLHEWWCSSCGCLNWAEAIFAGGTFASFETVPFTRETLSRIHFVGEGLLEYYREVTGKVPPPPHPGREVDLVREILAVTDPA